MRKRESLGEKVKSEYVFVIKRSVFGLACIALFLFFIVSAVAQQALPTLISLQGKLTNSSTGATIVTANLRVNISDIAGNTLWNETFGGGVSNGFFDLLLGSSANNPLNLSFNQDYNISIYVGDSQIQIGGTYRFRSGIGGINPSNITSGNFTALGNFTFGSALFVDKTNNRVGIGTASPSTALQVEGTATATAFSGDGSALTNVPDSTVFNLGNISNNTLVKGDNATLALWNKIGANDASFRLSGSVGIGTASPKTTLNVVGDIYHNLSTASQDFNIANATGDSRFFVDNSNGNIGIGTVSPSEPLEINTSSKTPLQLAGTDTQSTRLQILSDVGSWMVAVGGSIGSSVFPSGSFAIHEVGVITRLVIQNGTGNVGIGTTSPATNLDVKGKANFTGNFSIGQTSNIFFVDNTSGIVGIKTTNLSGSMGQFQVDGTVSIGNINSNEGILRITHAGNETYLQPAVNNVGGNGTKLHFANMKSTDSTMTIDVPNKMVGIGTTSPAVTLDVKGKANFTGNFSIGQTSNIFFVDNTSGNVGIGTASPADKLTQTGNVRMKSEDSRIIAFNSDTAYSLGSSGGAAIRFIADGLNDEIAFETHKSGVSHAERVRINSLGNVGIGTTGPTKKLSVNGTLNAFTVDPSASDVFLNTTGENLTITSATGSVIIQLG